MSSSKLMKCTKCDAIVEVVIPCDCADDCLKCCDAALVELKPNTVEAAHEKHIPVVSGDAHRLRVAVGSVPHPMTEAHYIQWVEVLDGAWTVRKNLAPGEAPAVEFHMPCKPGLIVRAYCNLHGLWQTITE